MELFGKTAIVTGSKTGIGFETALDLYQKGAKVFIACRNKEKGLDAIERMKALSDGGELVYGHLDLSNLQFQPCSFLSDVFVMKQYKTLNPANIRYLSPSAIMHYSDFIT